ncbi:MAG: pentapeptide repeat-containing protein [Alphaproteobacteria bacterium]|nr:pentapeptide repeat-containing protein [Alphaproteobacteria bacterium]
MENFRLIRHTDQELIFEGQFASLTNCLEQAIRENTDLSHIDLKNKNLSGGNFDGAYMPGALLSGTNLTGANISECCLRGGVFHHASLYNTCLCETDLRACDFRDSNFGATDITGADISFSRFSTLSCFDLAFETTQNMLGCTFESPDGHKCKMSESPLILRGIMSSPIIVMDQTVRIGGDIWCRKTARPLQAENAQKDRIAS